MVFDRTKAWRWPGASIRGIAETLGVGRAGLGLDLGVGVGTAESALAALPCSEWRFSEPERLGPQSIFELWLTASVIYNRINVLAVNQICAQ